MAAKLRKKAKKTAKPHWTQDVSEDSVYAQLISCYLHQDRLSWSRIQTIVVIEATLLAASYSQAGKLISAVILLLGTPVVWVILQLIRRDWQVRDQNLELLDCIHVPKNIRMAECAKSRWAKGSFLVPFVVYGLLALNAVLIICYTLLAFGVDTLSMKWLFGLD